MTAVVETFSTATGVDTVSISKPSGVATGDLLILICGDDAQNPGSGSWTSYTGWTLQESNGSNLSDASIGVYWRIADGTEPATAAPPHSSGEYVAWYLRITGHDDTTPIDVSTSTATGASTTGAAPSVTTTQDDCLVIACGAFDGGDGFPFTPSGTGWPSSVPANQELQQSTAASSSSGVWVSRTVATAGASNDCTFTASIADGWALAQIAIAPGATVPTITDVETDEEVRDLDTAVTITGSLFEGTQGTGKVELTQTSSYASPYEQTTIESWSDTAIDFTVDLGSLTPGTLYLWVTNNTGDKNAVGFPVTVHRAVAFQLSASGNVAPSAATATTDQLAAPAGKTKGTDFTAGRISDDTNPLPSIDIGLNQYTELEWVIEATTNTATSEVYDFRVVTEGGALDSYSVTPTWTIGTGAQTINPTAIAAGTTFGAPALDAGGVTVSPTGIAASTTIGSPSVDAEPVTINVTGIAATTTIGSPTLDAGTVTISPTAIAAGSTVGTPTVEAGTVTIDATAIASTTSFGAPTITQTINVTAIAPTTSVGAPALDPGTVTISPTAIASTVTFGAPTLSTAGTITPTAIAAATTFGTPTLDAGTVTINVTAVPPTTTLGAPTVDPGTVTISPTAMASTVTLGAPTVDPGGLTISPSAIAAGTTFGAPTLQAVTTLSVTAIAPTTTLGAPTVDPGTVTISPTGLASTVTLGAPTVIFAADFPRLVDITGEGTPVSIERQPAFTGPFIASNGDLYFFDEAPLPLPNSEASFYKSTDRGINWVRYGSGNGDDLEAGWAIQVPTRTDELLGIWQRNTNGRVASWRFGTSDHATQADTLIQEWEFHSPGDTILGEHLTACVWNTTDVLAVYCGPNGGTQDQIWGCVYSTATDTWGTPFVIADDTGDPGRSILPNVVTSDGATAHITYTTDSGDLFHKTYNTSSQLSAETRLNGAVGVFTADPFGSIVGVHHIGGVCHVVWHDGSAPKTSGKLYHNSLPDGGSAGTPTQITTRDCAADFTSGATIDGPNACTVVDGSTIYVVFSDATTHDLYTIKSSDGGATWVDETLIHTIDTMSVSAAVLEYAPNDRVIGIIVEDAEGGTPAEGQVLYTEVGLPAALTITPTGIAPTTTLGAPTVDAGGLTISPTAIAAGTTLGAPSVDPGGLTISPSAIGPTTTLGAPSVDPGTVTISVTAIAPTTTLGAPSVVVGVTTLNPSAIAPTTTLGAPSVTGTGVISPTAIAPTTTLGAPALDAGPVTINVTAIAPTTTLGAPALAGTVTLSVTAIGPTTTLGAPSVVLGLTVISPTAIGSTVGFGAPTLTPGGLTISPTGIAPTATIGMAQVIQILAIVLAVKNKANHARVRHASTPVQFRHHATQGAQRHRVRLTHP